MAVGLVISGEYFGWNYGWREAGTIGFLIVTVVVAILYVTFIFSFAELTTAMPKAGGPFIYALKAFGIYGGVVAGYATLVEFLFAAPAVAFALGSYAHFLNSAIPVLPLAIGCYFIFSLLNVFGIKESAMFSLFVTILAVVELLGYIGIVAPHFSFQNFVAHAIPFHASGLVKALPFAIWFFLAIEGVAMMAEEVKDPKTQIPKGYSYGIVTLVILAFGVMIVTGGVGDWRTLSHIDYPLPEAIALAWGKDNSLTNLFTSIGLFGLIASFHGVIVSNSRQVYALSRSGFLPKILSVVNDRFQTPHWALVAGGVVGIIGLCSGTTDKLIILSVIGALTMYATSMLSLFKLRKDQPSMDRPIRAPFYPYLPMIALILSVACLIGIVIYNLVISAIFFVGLLIMLIIFRFLKNQKPGEIEHLYSVSKDNA
jgi:ethanolamine permease